MSERKKSENFEAEDRVSTFLTASKYFGDNVGFLGGKIDMKDYQYVILDLSVRLETILQKLTQEKR